MRHSPRSLAALTLALFALLYFVSPLRAVGMAGETAPDFPPGQFSDGGHYRMADFEGKVLVLFFYEQTCPTCRGLIAERNKVVQQFKDKPVKFIAVGAGDPITDVMSYVRGTHLMMPSFADALGLMEHRYGQHLSLQNIYQFRIIGPDGKVVGYTMEPADIERALAGVKWKYKDAGYDPKLANIVELLEWNQHEPAIRSLRPFMKGKGPAADSAKKLMEVMKAEGQSWLDEAGKSKAADPVRAFDLYARVSASFAGDDLAKSADAALAGMKKDKTVADELAARGMFDQLQKAMSKATPTQKGEVVGYCAGIAKKYPNTPTGKRAAELAKELQELAMAG